jgi:alpha-beta hydrolase superfamily lysophospholipase
MGEKARAPQEALPVHPLRATRLASIVVLVLAALWSAAGPGVAGPEPPADLDGLARRPYLGFVVLPLEPANALRLGLASPRGAWIQLLAAGAPADEAGLEVDDVVVSVDGMEVAGPDDVRRLTQRATPGVPLLFEVIRDRRRREVRVTPGLTPLERMAGLVTRYDAVTVEPEVRLRRILIAPPTAPPHPAVLLVQEGTASSVEAGGYNPARELSVGLARRGIATVRFDRRGTGDSEGTPYHDQDLASELSDTRHVLGTMLTDPLIDPDSVIVLGFGTGALLAAELVREVPVAGLVAVSAPGRPVSDVVADSFIALAPEDERMATHFAPAIRSTYARLAAGEPLDTILADRPEWRSFLVDAKGRVHGRRAAYQAALGAVDPALRLGTVPGPVLVVRGDSDLLTTPADAARLDAALSTRDGASHRMVTLPSTGPLLAHATDLDDARRVLRRGELFFNPAVLDSVSAWILGHPVVSAAGSVPPRRQEAGRTPR